MWTSFWGAESGSSFGRRQVACSLGVGFRARTPQVGRDYLKHKERFALEKEMGAAALSFLGQKLFASSTLVNAKRENPCALALS